MINKAMIRLPLELFAFFSEAFCFQLAPKEKHQIAELSLEWMRKLFVKQSLSLALLVTLEDLKHNHKGSSCPPKKGN